MFATLGRRDRVSDSNGGLADTRRPDQEGVGPTLQSATQQRIEFGVAAGHEIARKILVVLRGDQAWINPQAAALDGEIMEAAGERNAPHLDNPQPPAFRAVVDRQLLEEYHAVHDRMELEILLLRSEVIEQDHGGLAAGEKVLQGQNLSAVAQGALRQQPRSEERRVGKECRSLCPT